MRIIAFLGWGICELVFCPLEWNPVTFQEAHNVLNNFICGKHYKFGTKGTEDEIKGGYWAPFLSCPLPSPSLPSTPNLTGRKQVNKTVQLKVMLPFLRKERWLRIKLRVQRQNWKSWKIITSSWNLIEFAWLNFKTALNRWLLLTLHLPPLRTTDVLDVLEQLITYTCPLAVSWGQDIQMCRLGGIVPLMGYSSALASNGELWYFRKDEI